MAPRRHLSPFLRLLLGLPALLAPVGCSNNPYPPGDTARATLYFSMSDDPKTMDPSVVYGGLGLLVAACVCPAYFEYDCFRRDPYVLKLNLGAAQPKREPFVDPRTKRRGESWTFRVKRGIRFQDDPCFPGGRGREVTAADFLYTLRRLGDPAVPCPIRAYIEDKILGYADYVAESRARAKKGRGAAYEMPIRGLQLDPSDPYTFRILLNQPYPQLRYLMTLYFTSPLPREAVERYGKEFARHPVGCGPFVLDSYVPKQQIVLRANPNRRVERYPDEGPPEARSAGLLRDAGRPMPLVDRVVFSTIREQTTGWNLFLQGYQDTWSVMQENYEQVMSRQGQLSQEMIERGVQLHRATSANIGYFAFNMEDSLVGGYTPKKRRLRQAISMAMEARAFIDLFSQGMGQPADFLVPPGMLGYEKGYRNPYRQTNLTRAKQLLAEAGYPDGLDPATGEPLTIYFDNGATDAAGRQWVALVKKQVEALGLRLETRSWRGVALHDRVQKGQFQLIRAGWGADYPDPENFVFLLYGPNCRPGPNVTNYANPEFDRLFEQMRALDDGPERLALIRRLREVAVEDCPVVYMSHDEGLFMTHGWMRNTFSHPLVWDWPKYLAVDGPRRARLQVTWNRPLYTPLVVLGLFLFAGSLPAAATLRRRRRRRARRST